LQLSDEEKSALLKIASLCTKDKTTIREVMFAILSYSTLESFHSDESEIILPYIGKIKFKYEEEPNDKGFTSKVIMTAEPMPSLIKEFISIRNGEEPPSKKHIRKQNRFHIDKLISGLDI